MTYNELTRRYFDTAPGAGTLDETGRYRGAAGNRGHGAWVQFDVRASRDARCIEAVRFLAFACPHVIAVAAWVTEHAIGLGIEPRLPRSVHELRERFAVPTEKMGRLLIVEDAWVASMLAAREAMLNP